MLPIGRAPVAAGAVGVTLRRNVLAKGTVAHATARERETKGNRGLTDPFILEIRWSTWRVEFKTDCRLAIPRHFTRPLDSRRRTGFASIPGGSGPATRSTCARAAGFVEVRRATRVQGRLVRGWYGREV